MRTTANITATRSDPKSPTAVHHAADVATDKRAHTFFWCVLFTSAAVSVTGNAVHAVLHAHALPVVAAAVAVVPPITLLAAVHGVTVLLRAHAPARWIHVLATVMTVLIAAGAFRLSFTALRDLAVLAAVPDAEAWLWPIIIEGSMAQATVALLALAHSNPTRALEPPAPAGPADLRASPAQSSAAHIGRQTENSRAHSASCSASVLLIESARDANQPSTPKWSRVASSLCDRDPAHRRDPVEVATILTRHHDDGWTPTQISREIQRSRSTISRIISDAAQLQPL